MTVLRGNAWAIGEAGIASEYQDDWDLKSFRRFLYRNLGGDAGPKLFIEPDEGMFSRPAVTIRLATTRQMSRAARRPTYDVEHALVVMVYGRDRAETVTLAKRVWRLMNEGGAEGPAFRIPMWEFASGNRLSRWMRVESGSLSMSLDATDDEGQWQRSIEVRVKSPRMRLPRGLRPPVIASVVIN